MEKLEIGNQKNLAIKTRSMVLPSNVKHAQLIYCQVGMAGSAHAHTCSFNFLLNIEIHNELEL